jgi:hypothetical protein
VTGNGFWSFLVGGFFFLCRKRPEVILLELLELWDGRLPSVELPELLPQLLVGLFPYGGHWFKCKVLAGFVNVDYALAVHIVAV